MTTTTTTTTTMKHQEKVCGMCVAGVHRAIRNHHLPCVQGHMSLSPSNIEEYLDGNTPLQLASKAGDADIVSYFLEHCHASIDSRGEFFNTALMLATMRGHLDVMEILIAHGANVHLLDGDGNNLLFKAVKWSDAETVRFVVELGVFNIEGTDVDLNTPLLIACSKANVEIIEYLLSVNANKEVKNRLGNTPLLQVASKQFSSSQEHVYPAIRALVKAGCDVFIKNNNGATVVHMLLSSQSVFERRAGRYRENVDRDTIKVILDAFFDVDATDKHGNTPLLLATSGEEEEVVKLLIEYHANPHLVGAAGKTALQLCTDDLLASVTPLTTVDDGDNENEDEDEILAKKKRIQVLLQEHEQNYQSVYILK